jgi:hypothetical protein
MEGGGEPTDSRKRADRQSPLSSFLKLSALLPTHSKLSKLTSRATSLNLDQRLLHESISLPTTCISRPNKVRSWCVQPPRNASYSFPELDVGLGQRVVRVWDLVPLHIATSG